jgi:uncharacterized protein (TIGR04255 family)
MTVRPSDLPDFEAPPVVEVVLGVRFTAAASIRVFHVGLYRELIKADFPEFQEQPPLPSRDEPGLEFMQGPPPLPRSWFLDKTGTKLIQLQTDRFMHNWRKVTGMEHYPRYEAIRDEFARRWSQFACFLADHGLGQPVLGECELTYVNHIPKGTCWSEPKDLPAVFAFLADGLFARRAGPPESVGCGLRYRLPEGRGHLHVTMGPAIRTQAQQEVVRFDLSARGSMMQGGSEAMLEWYDRARECIVWTFTELTTQTAHHCWGRKTR